VGDKQILLYFAYFYSKNIFWSKCTLVCHRYTTDFFIKENFNYFIFTFPYNSIWYWKSKCLIYGIPVWPCKIRGDTKHIFSCGVIIEQRRCLHVHPHTHLHDHRHHLRSSRPLLWRRRRPLAQPPCAPASVDSACLAPPRPRARCYSRSSPDQAVPLPDPPSSLSDQASPSLDLASLFWLPSSIPWCPSTVWLQMEFLGRLSRGSSWGSRCPPLVCFRAALVALPVWYPSCHYSSCNGSTVSHDVTLKLEWNPSVAWFEFQIQTLFLFSNQVIWTLV
jgi:hypothetical protein